MYLYVDLLKLPGADTAVLDGVEGIFIPKVPNLTVCRYRSRLRALLHLRTLPCTPKGKMDRRVFLRIPPYYTDAAFADERVSSTQGLAVGTGWSIDDKRRATDGVVTMADLDDILKD